MPEFRDSNVSDQRTIKRILKVNHAGEYGAIRIYRAQIWVARRWYPEIVEFLEETLGHEVKHLALFASAMPPRRTRPCYVMSLWGNGGFVLGFLTALFGQQSIWICTSAVEATVHKHLNHQLMFLDGKDDKLLSLIKSIQIEELQHLEHANLQIIKEGKRSWFLRMIISGATEVLIWLSTWGDSTKMVSELDLA